MEYEKFMKTCSEKINDGELIYRASALFIAKRFKIEIGFYGDVDDSVYAILNHYIEEVDEDFETWLNKNDAPMIRSVKELRTIFHEFRFIESDAKLIETVNKIYGLDLELSDSRQYFYSLGFDFNSFTPIDAEEIHCIKSEIRVLEKYGFPTDELEEKLKSFNVSSEILEAL